MDIHEQLNAGVSNLQNKNAILIYRGKNKIRGLLIRSFLILGMILLAILVAWKEDHSSDKFTGVLGAFFCAVAAIFVIISVWPKLKQETPAIILDEKGIVWNMNQNEPLRIYWENISGIKNVSFRAMNFLLVEVNNSYQLKQGRKGMQSFFMQMNEMIFGSPVCFRASTLEINFEKLNSAFRNALTNWKKGK